MRTARSRSWSSTETSTTAVSGSVAVLIFESSSCAGIERCRFSITFCATTSLLISSLIVAVYGCELARPGWTRPPPRLITIFVCARYTGSAVADSATAAATHTAVTTATIHFRRPITSR